MAVFFMQEVWRGEILKVDDADFSTFNYLSVRGMDG